MNRTIANEAKAESLHKGQALRPVRAAKDDLSVLLRKEHEEGDAAPGFSRLLYRLPFFGVLPHGVEKFEAYNVVIDIDGELVRSICASATQHGSLPIWLTAEGTATDPQRKLLSSKYITQTLNILDGVARGVHDRIEYDRGFREREAAGKEYSTFRFLPIEYFAEKGGVCRHQAVAVIAALQRLREEGYLQGILKFAIGNTEGKRGFVDHVWVEHIDGYDQTLTIDATWPRVAIGVPSGYEPYQRPWAVSLVPLFG